MQLVSGASTVDSPAKRPRRPSANTSSSCLDFTMDLKDDEVADGNINPTPTRSPSIPPPKTCTPPARRHVSGHDCSSINPHWRGVRRHPYRPRCRFQAGCSAFAREACASGRSASAGYFVRSCPQAPSFMSFRSFGRASTLSSSIPGGCDDQRHPFQATGARG